MDLFSRRDDKLPQGNHQGHPQNAATIVGQPGSSYNSYGATFNMAAGYYTRANQLPNQNSNHLTSYSNNYNHHGAGTVGFGQTIHQNSNPRLSQLGPDGSREIPAKSGFHQSALSQTPSSYIRYGLETDPSNQKSDFLMPQVSLGGSRENPSCESLLNQTFKPSSSFSGYGLRADPSGANINTDFSRTVSNQISDLHQSISNLLKSSQFSQGESRELPTIVRQSSPNPCGINLDPGRTSANESLSSATAFLTSNPCGSTSGSHLIMSRSLNSQPSPSSNKRISKRGYRRTRKKKRKPRVMGENLSFPSPPQNPNASTSSQYVGNMPLNPVLDNSQYRPTHPIPSGSQLGKDQPIRDFRQHVGNRPVPDGTTTNLKFPPPEMKNLLFDSSTGYRFDPTTGLHYDANSGFYINNRLKVLLRWDPITSTYVLVSNNASGLAKPAIVLMKETRDSPCVSAGLPHSRVEELARQLAKEMLTPGTQEPDLNRNRYETSLQSSEFPRTMPTTQDPDLYFDCGRYDTSTSQKRSRSANFHPSAAKRPRWSSPVRQIPVGDLRDRLRRGPEPHGCYPSSSPLELVKGRGDKHNISPDRYDVRDRMREDRCNHSFGKSRSPPRQSGSPLRRRESYGSRDRDASIAKIHEHNLRDAHNLYGRYFSMYLSPTPYILVAPVPPKNELKRSLVAKQLEDVLSYDKMAVQSVRVYQGGFGAPCNYALVQFHNEDDAFHWYKLHQGTVKLSAPFLFSFLFFSEDHWFCKKQHSGDKGCDTPTPNFPFRTICYLCLELRSRLESPIIKTETPSQWIGITQLDCIKYSAVTDVMQKLPPHKGISIESTEFLREPNGIPIGICVFQILDEEQAINFFTILKNGKFNVSYVLLDKKALDVAPTSMRRSRHRSRDTARSVTCRENRIRLRDKDPTAGASNTCTSLRRGEVEIPSVPKQRGSKASEQDELTPTEKYMEKLPYDLPRGLVRHHKRFSNNEKQQCHKKMLEEFDEEFMVIDEYEAEEEGDAKETKPSLRQPRERNQIIKEHLQNVDSYHSKNSEDPDNILRDLFVKTPTLKPFVLLSPVPRDKDLAIKELEKILTSDRAKNDCQDFGVFQGKGLGAPCDYGLVRFYKPVKALDWYNRHKALLHLNDGSNDQFKAFMFFSPNNWTCLRCKFTNFPLRNWCVRCFKNKNQNVFSPISESNTPSNILGIASSGLPNSMPESSFTTENIIATLPAEEAKRVVSSKMMLEDKGLPGLCVLETQDSKECENLRKHLQLKGWRVSFLRMLDEPSDSGKLSDKGQTSDLGKASDPGKASDSGIATESEKTCDSDNPSGTDDSESDKGAAPMGLQQKNTALVNSGERKYDLMKHIFDNNKQSECIILSPAPRVKWLKVKQHLDDLLLDDGLNFSCSFDLCRPEVYGSSQQYIEVRFTDLEKAVTWYKKHNGIVEFLFPETAGRKEGRSQMRMYYAGKAWPCRACSTLNFSARSLCHKCYAHRDENGFTPVTISNTPTRWVGISCLQQSIYNVDQVKKVLPPLYPGHFSIMRIQFIREPNPLLYLGLCVIETLTESDGQGLAEYIKRHPALKYNSETSARAIFVNLNERCALESCKKDAGVDSCRNDSADAPWTDALDVAFRLNDSPHNFSLWWKNIRNSVREGDDFLKYLFEDQFVVPLPAGDSVFVPLPDSQHIITPRTEKTDQPVRFNSKVYSPLFEKAGIKKEMAENAKLYTGRCLGSPCTYTILTFKTASEAISWRARHNGKWIIDMGNGTQWTSFLHSCDPNWKCHKCNHPNFPLRLYCFCCFEHRFGGAPLVAISETPTRFIGITKFQNWCASEELLFENIKILPKMKENQQLKQVDYIFEQSGLPLGICVLELENADIARTVFSHLMSLTQRMQNIVYVEMAS